ncbi:hotdog fold thioesterase [Rossellomorea marisflavi]|uniref:Esterase n=1 Tax=Rossellomorea marisflavi TaxID=189381 RepID=A0A0J5TD22_9BACI|nr:hotdog fold thioesterase [Rossellomorea marisflavi]KMK91810.1 esterase [Rossellomorea marisflavi]KML05048.1 esterase [Rossellomorea marisflavi]KML35068.1 esterase [Rossellomorea marisflavi]KZE48084.1 esterase [Rossellomorea marisflavi]QHA37407.1 hotdog fold thioesterase [Rossellomorea marisflavi]
MNLDHTLISALGIDFITVEKGKIVATMPVNEQTRQPFGFLHGGASVALAETVASVGAVELIDLDKEICFGLEINANHIKAKKDGEVTATATVLHQGRTTMVWDIKITDEANDLICVSRCTMAVVPKKNV